MSVFDLARVSPSKAAARQIAGDEAHFETIAAALAQGRQRLQDQLEAARSITARAGQAALARDQEVRRLVARRAVLERFSRDVVLGRMVHADGTVTRIGRLGLSGPDEERLLIDWRTEAAAPFFRATAADPMGLASRRRYRWASGRVVDYWDELLDPTSNASGLAIDDDSAFLAGLATSRAATMRDVLTTIAADQDRVVRAPARPSVVVDGGPGTGKTVVALHRTAFLLHDDPRIGERQGGVLVVGPHQPYLAYVADVLPSLGETDVRTATVRDLLPEGATALPEADPEAARLKGTAGVVDWVARAVAIYEEPPTRPLNLETPWCTVRIDPDDWAEVFAASDPGLDHNQNRDVVWQALVDLVHDRHPVEEGVLAEVPVATVDQVARVMRQDPVLVDLFERAWTLLDAEDMVADLWTVPALLRHAAPELVPEQVQALQRREGDAWTLEDLPLLDAARRLVGSRAQVQATRAAERVLNEQRAEMDAVVDRMVAADLDFESVATMLLGDDMRDKLVDNAEAPGVPRDLLAGPFAHVVVDEAQDLTDAQWQMLVARCPSRSFTVVGDRAQSRAGFPETWPERMARLGMPQSAHHLLTVNYRTPAEVMEAAAPVILAALPDANVPTSIRRGGVVRRGFVADLPEVLEAWLATHQEGTACVVTIRPAEELPAPVPPRVQVLSPELVKGLEFDFVVVLAPAEFGPGLPAAVDTYVAMTRPTAELCILT